MPWTGGAPACSGLASALLDMVRPGAMPIQVGQRVPEGTLSEFIEQETPGCALGPNNFQVSKLVAGKRIVVFGLPGAFTPTCSAKHVPGYVAHAADSRPAAWTRCGASRSTTPS